MRSIGSRLRMTGGYALIVGALMGPAGAAAAVAHARVDGPATVEHDAGSRQHGNASFYSKHLSGRRTASGERYDPKALTAAHRTLPIGTQVKVVNPKNDRSVVVTVNDRGPVPKNRMIDVSGAAADALRMTKSGVTRVETQVVGKATGSRGGEVDSKERGADTR